MSAPNPSTDPPPRILLPPLTCKKTDGSAYLRPSDIVEEIGRALTSDPSTWSLRKLKSETLVHLIRTSRVRDDETLLGPLIHEVGKRIARIAHDWAKGFDPITTEEILVQVGEQIISRILADPPTRQSDYLEIDFRRIVKGRTLNQVEKRELYPRSHQFVSTAADLDTAASGLAMTIDDVADEGPTPEDIVCDAEVRALTPERLRAGLAAISDPRHRQAVVLRYLEGWPIFDQDSKAQTLHTHFGISPRQIQKWIGVALAEMKEAMGEDL